MSAVVEETVGLVEVPLVGVPIVTMTVGMSRVDDDAVDEEEAVADEEEVGDAVGDVTPGVDVDVGLTALE